MFLICTPPGFTHTFKWKFIEGVGPNNGIPLPVNLLLCSYKDGVRVFTNEFGANCIESNIGIGENAKPVFNISPNPVKHELKIQVDSQENYQYYLINIEGSRKAEGSFNQSVNLDLSLYPSGIYIIHLFNHKTSYYVKIMKQ